MAALEWAINEITDNVLNHASSPIGGLVQLTTKSKSNIVEFAVCDAGVGIPKTLREGHADLTTDVIALDRAIREGVTRNRTTNMGNGLFGSFRLAQLSDGYFSIYSGYALLNFTRKSGLRVSHQAIPYSGTAIVCGVKPDILAEALSFRGERYTPGRSALKLRGPSGPPMRRCAPTASVRSCRPALLAKAQSGGTYRNIGPLSWRSRAKKQDKRSFPHPSPRPTKPEIKPPLSSPKRVATNPGCRQLAVTPVP